jgi:hypothetical protein
MVSLPGNAGEVLSGFDGEIAWSFDPRTKTAQVFDGVDRQSMKFLTSGLQGGAIFNNRPRLAVIAVHGRGFRPS